MILTVLPLAQYTALPACFYSFGIPKTALLKEEYVLMLILQLIPNPP